MKIIRLLVVAGAVWFAFHWWKGREAHESRVAQDGGAAQTGRTSQESPNGFIEVAMPDGARNNTVLIFAPVNCPSDAAQRADDLADKLTRLGIPNMRSSSFSSSINNPTKEQREGVERAVSVMNGAIPAVFINGMAKANPTVEEVAAEFERMR